MLNAILWVVKIVEEIERSCVEKCFSQTNFNFQTKHISENCEEIVCPSNIDLIEKLPEYMQCDDIDYESINSELYGKQ